MSRRMFRRRCALVQGSGGDVGPANTGGLPSREASRIVSLLGNVKLGGLTNHHRDAFLIDGAAIGIAQLHSVGTWPQREFLGLPCRCRIAAIDVNRNVLPVGIDLDLTVVRPHVGRRVGVISVGVERIEKRPREGLHDDHATAYALRRGNRGHPQKKTPPLWQRSMRSNPNAMFCALFHPPAPLNTVRTGLLLISLLGTSTGLLRSRGRRRNNKFS